MIGLVIVTHGGDAQFRNRCLLERRYRNLPNTDP